MSFGIGLSGEKEEWLVRAAMGGTSPVMPADAVEAIVAAGLGETNGSGKLEVNSAGRAYIEARNLWIRTPKRRRR